MTLIVAVLASLVLSSAAHAAPARVAPSFFGMNIDFDRVAKEKRDATLEAVKGVGVRSVKVGVGWDAVQPYGPNDALWGNVDDQIARLARHGVEAIANVGYGVSWAMRSSDKLDANLKNVPYEDLRFYRPDPYMFAEFARKVVNRYGRGGTFWAAHPELPYTPVKTYEIWNEPNMQWAYRPAPDPEEFGGLFRTAGGAMRAEDPAAKIVVGGLAAYTYDTTGVIATHRFLDRMGVWGADGIAIHSYAPSLNGLIAPIKSLREYMVMRGLQSKPIYVTEWGWAAPPYADGLSDSFLEAARPTLHRRFADLISRSDCGVETMQVMRWLTFGDSDHASGWSQGLGLSLDGITPRWTARALGALADKQAGAAPDAARATVHLCGLSAPDKDGDGVQDQHDYAPIDPAVRQAPTQSAPSGYENPVLSGQAVTGKTLRTTLGTWNGSPLPSLTVARWEHCNLLLLDCRTMASSGNQVTLPLEAAGRVVRSVVRASNSLGSAERASVATEIVGTPARFTSPTTLSGDPKVGGWLALHPGDIVSIPWLSLSERTWERCTGYNSGCSVIAVGPMGYSPRIGDYTKRIRVTFRIANQWGSDSVSFITSPVHL